LRRVLGAEAFIGVDSFDEKPGAAMKTRKSIFGVSQHGVTGGRIQAKMAEPVDPGVGPSISIAR